jgi:tetrapyrrole methylase family protein/MazG family protein
VEDAGKKLMRFMNIVNQLRSEKGCPWDRKQSPLSLKRYILEETHELLDAIDTDDHQHVKEELGDLLYLIILLAQIHSEKQFFNMSEVIEAISDKMVRRHPHVFQDEQFDSEAQLREKWLAIKAREKSDRAKAKKN